ncbi:hypothetical protein F0562_022584 [Nyssa sinensis]|uniref:Uncharacterized protein n=1 Tax=Nyssa sinensis TaxID=561372 RepID=A0A5J5BS35_9ASTE|nr:hypothetical protein F0562_022584 [Nyssa sinensis]
MVIGVEALVDNVEEKVGLDNDLSSNRPYTPLPMETTKKFVANVVNEAEGANGVDPMPNKATEGLGSRAPTEGAEAKGMVKKGAQGGGVIPSDSTSLGQPTLYDITLSANGHKPPRCWS